MSKQSKIDKLEMKILSMEESISVKNIKKILQQFEWLGSAFTKGCHENQEVAEAIHEGIKNKWSNVKNDW